MAGYVDGFLLPVPKGKLEAYRKISAAAGKVWIEYGALDYVECVGDDLKTKMAASFPAMAGAKKGELVIFSWIFYKSRAHRDRVNAKVMKDPRISKAMGQAMPVDMTRMAYGGFKVFVHEKPRNSPGLKSRPTRVGRGFSPGAGATVDFRRG
jgi:uncharacterized protein YbaA (DUF1428 family)